MPTPALVSTTTSWPAAVSSATEAGVRPTRYSWTLISLGTPTRIFRAPLIKTGGSIAGREAFVAVAWHTSGC